jgi:MFS family permease
VLGPIISFRSDRFRSRWGRRIPFLLIPTPVAAAAMCGLAFCQQLGNLLHNTLGQTWSVLDQTNSTLIVFGLCWTLFEFAVITAGAVFGGLVNDVVPRPVIGRFFGLFRAVSLGAGMIFNYTILTHAETHFTEIFIGMALLFGIGFTIMCLKVKEGDYPPPDPHVSDHRAGGFFHAVHIYSEECFSKPYYLWIYFAMFFAGITFLPYNLYSILWRDQVNMSLQTYGTLIAVSYGVSLTIAWFLGWAVDKFHSLRVGMVAMALYALSAAWGYLFVHDSITFGIGLVLHTVLSGTYFTATAPLGQALFPRMKFGQYASAGGFLGGALTLVAAPIVGAMLDFSEHDYRMTFLFATIFSITALGLLFASYRHFLSLGGPTDYVAPDHNADADAIAAGGRHPDLRTNYRSFAQICLMVLYIFAILASGTLKRPSPDGLAAGVTAMVLAALLVRRTTGLALVLIAAFTITLIVAARLDPRIPYYTVAGLAFIVLIASARDWMICSGANRRVGDQHAEY